MVFLKNLQQLTEQLVKQLTNLRVLRSNVGLSKYTVNFRRVSIRKRACQSVRGQLAAAIPHSPAPASNPEPYLHSAAFRVVADFPRSAVQTRTGPA